MYHFKFVLLSTAFATMLGGCAQSAIKFRPTMGADASEIGYEAQGLVNEMRQAYVEDLPCTTIAPSFQNTATEGYQRLGTSPGEKTKRFGCVRFKNPKDAALSPQKYYAAGLALSDIYCDDYFRRIAEHKQKRQFGRSTTNDIGTAASAGLGLASAGSILTGGIGAAFGLADNLFRNYDNAFVVEPNLGKMLKLIKTAQSTLKSSTEAGSFTDYFEAHRAVSEYAQLCSYVGMDALLDHAIESGTDALTVESTTIASQTTKDRLRLKLKEEKLRIAKAEADVDSQMSALNATAPADANPPAEPADNPPPP